MTKKGAAQSKPKPERNGRRRDSSFPYEAVGMMNAFVLAGVDRMSRGQHLIPSRTLQDVKGQMQLYSESLAAAIPQAAEITAWTPKIYEVISSNDAESKIFLGYAVARLMRGAISIQGKGSLHKEIWSEVWTTVDSKPYMEAVKKDATLRRHLPLHAWQSKVEKESVRKFQTLKNISAPHIREQAAALRKVLEERLL